MKPEDIAGIIYDVIKREKDDSKGSFFLKNEFNPPYTSLKNKKRLITEYDIKQMLQPGTYKFVVKKDMILSPLAYDYLISHGIVVEYE
ncbi:MAG: hypothetical protein NZ870_03060 [bacterium]|nr:hypothetical protein [bacterium]